MACLSTVALAWALGTWVFWLGYAGVDDMFYARYAYLFNRPPANWWEFRMPAILAIRGSFGLLGPTEFAAAAPTLVASLMMAGSVALLTGWPRNSSWQAHAAMLLVVTMPWDVSFRSYPAAPVLAAGFLTLGTACVLKGAAGVRSIGAALLAVGFMTHEVSMFYVGLLCLVLMITDHRRFGMAVVFTVASAAMLVLLEGAVYHYLLGDFFARFRVAAATTAETAGGLDPDGLMTDTQFLLWPLQNVIFSKPFGFAIGALFVTGGIAWRRLGTEWQVLLASTALLWLWLGYGTQVPWAYKPLYRQFHYYGPLVLGLAAALPVAATRAFSKATHAKVVVALVLLGNLAGLAAGGRWGAAVDVSRRLLTYAAQHRDETFITDVATLNEMYVVGGFQLPQNVVALNEPGVARRLLVNSELPSPYRFREERITGILLNREQEAQRGFEPEFTEYVRRHAGSGSQVSGVQYRMAFVPALAVIAPRPFMVKSLGGDLIPVKVTEAAGNDAATSGQVLHGN